VAGGGGQVFPLLKVPWTFCERIIHMPLFSLIGGLAVLRPAAERDGSFLKAERAVRTGSGLEGEHPPLSSWRGKHPPLSGWRGSIRRSRAGGVAAAALGVEGAFLDGAPTEADSAPGRQARTGGPPGQRAVRGDQGALGRRAVRRPEGGPEYRVLHRPEKSSSGILPCPCSTRPGRGRRMRGLPRTAFAQLTRVMTQYARRLSSGKLRPPGIQRFPPCGRE
jgi:hypothetical protein